MHMNNTPLSRHLRACLRLVLLLLCLSSGPALLAQEGKSTVVQTINGKKYYIHKVEKGQSLYGIARLYSTDVNAILAENHDAIDGLKPGQELRILHPNQPPVTTAAATGTATPAVDTLRYICHKVQKGETLYAILKKYNKTEKQLLLINPGLNANIREGQYIALAERMNRTTVAVAPKKDSLLVKSRDTLATAKPSKQSYNVGLFLPFRFNDTELINPDDYARTRMNFPSHQSISADFYLGFKNAMDSLTGKGFEVSLRLFDVDDRDSLKLVQLCRQADFKTLDLVVGPLYTSAFKIVSQHAKDLGVPVVSPTASQSKMLFNNPYVSKVNPSVFTLIDGLSEFCADSLSAGSQVLIVNDGSVKDHQYLAAFKKHYNERLLAAGKTAKDSIIEVKGLAGVKAAYSGGRRNVVVLLTGNQVYLADFITQLYVFSERKDIVLLGFSSVSEIDNLDQEYLNRLQFHFATPNCINYNDTTTTLGLVRFYQGLMNTDPSDYFFEGYDVANYYLKHLKELGPVFFLQLDKYKTEGISTRFNFVRPDAMTGFENKAVFIYRYDNYRLRKLRWRN